MLTTKSDPGVNETLAKSLEGRQISKTEAMELLFCQDYHGILSTARSMRENILQTTGLLPHTNAGSLTKKEMSLLKDTNVSMGVMLESSSERLTQKGMPHEMAPSKNPKVRIKTLEDAGDLRIPTTTGLLIGIGEEPQDIIDS